MAPLITNPRATYHAVRVTVDLAAAPPVQTHKARPIHFYRLDLSYEWGSNSPYGREYGEDGQDWYARVHYYGKMVKPSGQPGNTEVSGSLSKYQVDEIDWLADLIDEYMPKWTPTSTLGEP